MPQAAAQAPAMSLADVQRLQATTTHQQLMDQSVAAGKFPTVDLDLSMVNRDLAQKPGEGWVQYLQRANVPQQYLASFTYGLNGTGFDANDFKGSLNRLLTSSSAPASNAAPAPGSSLNGNPRIGDVGALLAAQAQRDPNATTGPVTIGQLLGGAGFKGFDPSTASVDPLLFAIQCNLGNTQGGGFRGVDSGNLQPAYSPGNINDLSAGGNGFVPFAESVGSTMAEYLRNKHAGQDVSGLAKQLDPAALKASITKALNEPTYSPDPLSKAWAQALLSGAYDGLINEVLKS